MLIAAAHNDGVLVMRLSVIYLLFGSSAIVNGNTLPVLHPAARIDGA